MIIFYKFDIFLNCAHNQTSPHITCTFCPAAPQPMPLTHTSSSVSCSFFSPPPKSTFLAFLFYLYTAF